MNVGNLAPFRKPNQAQADPGLRTRLGYALSRFAVLATTATLALSATEGIALTPVASADNCTTVTDGPTTTTHCESDGGGSSTTSTSSGSSTSSETNGNVTPSQPDPGTETTPSTPAPETDPSTPEPSNTDTDPAEPKQTMPSTATPKHKKKKSASTKKMRHYDHNMHEDPDSVLSASGCGVESLGDAISYLEQRSIDGKVIKPQISKWYSKDGRILASPYMDGAAPHIAKAYGYREYKTTIGKAAQAIKHGGAVIMLAEGYPGSIITHNSHYFESDEVKDGKLVIHDPNQHPNRHFDKSLRSANWLMKHHVQRRVWVIAPVNS